MVEVEDHDDGGPGSSELADESEDEVEHHVGGSWSQDGADWATNTWSLEEIQQQIEQREQQREQKEQEKIQKEQEKLQKRQERQKQRDLQHKPSPRQADICTCNACGAKACVPCDRPWHAHETCEQYRSRIQDRIEEEDATLSLIQSKTKRCPNCSKNIEKSGGCNHMYCMTTRKHGHGRVWATVRANVAFYRYPVPL